MPRKPNPLTEEQRTQAYVYDRLIDFPNGITASELHQCTRKLYPEERRAALRALIETGDVVEKRTRPESGHGPDIRTYVRCEFLPENALTPEEAAEQAAIDAKYFPQLRTQRKQDT